MNDFRSCRCLRILVLAGLVVPLGQVSGQAQQSSPPAPADGSVLPFPPVPSASVAGPTLQESTMKWRKEPERLKPGAPNILIVLIDDVGFGCPRHLRRRGPHTDSVPACATRESATTLPHDVDLLAQPRRPADRPQPSPGR